MWSRFLRGLQRLDLEERILNAGALVALIGVFLPWMSRELEGREVMFTGFGFFIREMGIVIAFMNAFILAIVLVPLCGGPHLLKRRHENAGRLLLALQSLLFTFAAFSVLLHATFEFYRTEIRFGLYVTMIGTVAAGLEAFLKWQQQRRSEVQNFFHHPEGASAPVERKDSVLPPPPPPPPPPPLQPEEHKPYRRATTLVQ